MAERQAGCCPVDPSSCISAQPAREDFVYEPLDHNSDSTRLIELYSDRPDFEIRCTMRQVRLSEAQYT